MYLAFYLEFILGQDEIILSKKNKNIMNNNDNKDNVPQVSNPPPPLTKEDVLKYWILYPAISGALVGLGHFTVYFLTQKLL